MQQSVLSFPMMSATPHPKAACNKPKCTPDGMFNTVLYCYSLYGTDCTLQCLFQLSSCTCQAERTERAAIMQETEQHQEQQRRNFNNMVEAARAEAAQNPPPPYDPMRFRAFPPGEPAQAPTPPPPATPCASGPYPQMRVSCHLRLQIKTITPAGPILSPMQSVLLIWPGTSCHVTILYSETTICLCDIP